ncbi:MAG: NUDIX domain-containing protein [Alphaproteobacteria bacterium]|nr:NUDIX domain-containing protein [Alphaproteobacteria bacterium]
MSWISGSRVAALRRRLEPFIRHFVHFYFRFARGMTLGVRALVLDGEGRVFLVRHSYVEGWYLPGGGVDVGETMAEAMARELKEEGNIDLAGEAVLHGIFFNGHVSRRDHVAVYVVRHFTRERAFVPNHEIVETGFFLPTALPPGTTPGTRLRIAEVLDGRPLIATWR